MHLHDRDRVIILVVVTFATVKKWLFLIEEKQRTHLAGVMKEPLCASSVLGMEVRAAAALVSFPSHMDRAWGTICPLLFASMGPNSSIIFLTDYLLVMSELYG